MARSLSPPPRARETAQEIERRRPRMTVVFDTSVLIDILRNAPDLPNSRGEVPRRAATTRSGRAEPPPQPPPGLPLPEFRYHPDPRATGVIVASEARCVACSRTRGFIYTGPVYAEQEFIDAFCPWCIADGTAARRFDAEF